MKWIVRNSFGVFLIKTMKMIFCILLFFFFLVASWNSVLLFAKTSRVNRSEKFSPIGKVAVFTSVVFHPYFASSLLLAGFQRKSFIRFDLVVKNSHRTSTVFRIKISWFQKYVFPIFRYHLFMNGGAMEISSLKLNISQEVDELDWNLYGV